MLYTLYFKINNNYAQLPVNPEEYVIGKKGSNERYRVLELGNIVIPRGSEPITISWEGIFPYNLNDFPLVKYSGNYLGPEYFIKHLYKAMDEVTPIRFIANRYMEDGSAIFDTNIMVVVENFEAKEKGGETGDFYYSIELAEFQDSTPRVYKKDNSQDNKYLLEPQRPTNNPPITVGSNVLVNGTVYVHNSVDWALKHVTNAYAEVIRIESKADNPDALFTHYIRLDGITPDYGWVNENQLIAVK